MLQVAAIEYSKLFVYNIVVYNEYFVNTALRFLPDYSNYMLFTLLLIILLILFNSFNRTYEYSYDFMTPYLIETSNNIQITVQKIFGVKNNYKNQNHFPEIISRDFDASKEPEKPDELVFMLDRDGNILYANKKTLMEFHFDMHDMLGESIFDVYKKFGNMELGWFEQVKAKNHSNNLIRLISEQEEKWFLINYRSNYDSRGELETIMATGDDVSFLIKSESVKEFYSEKDQLTGLINQYGMFDQLRNLKNVQSGVVFFIQAMNFMQISNYYGHNTGNKLLNAIVEELKDIVSENCLVVRYTDSTFVIICTNIDVSEESLSEYIEKLSNFATSSYEIGDLNLQIDKRIGYAVYPEDTDKFEDTISLASIALKEASAMSQFEITRFNLQMKADLKQNIEIANKLKDALDEEIIEVYFQKAINCTSNEVFVIEELSRWRDEELGFIPPDVFFKIAKETNQLYRLDRYMVERSLASFAKLRECKPQYGNSKLTINISPTTLLDINFFDFFNRLVYASGVAPSDIFIEISETTFVNNVNVCLARINQFKKSGYLIALDDFGTEYSSLSILESVDFDIIKIDAHFVQNIDKFSNQEIIKMIRKITSQNSKEIVAEGVETAEQSLALQNLGCLIQQGYYHHRPENLLLY